MVPVAAANWRKRRRSMDWLNRSCLGACESNMNTSLPKSSRSGHRDSPVRDRAVPPVVELPALKVRFGELGDLRELFEIDFNTQTRPVVRIELALLEIEAYRQVRQ